ncbi:hypothetical protein ElyMa_002383800 [Elysia marginata]|uniref:Uncharacterized protein n=1 Tax=Elysia marginata TaxID=1093978 RepID=A0AAV4GDA0_9GAST|nr:hypothetical protein ElyMa_002383800 [Elysia marginata]
MKTALLLCLAVAVFTAAAFADDCIKHVRGEPGTPCKGKRFVRNWRTKTTFCCQSENLYVVMQRQNGAFACSCVSRDEVRPEKNVSPRCKVRYYST